MPRHNTLALFLLFTTSAVAQPVIDYNFSLAAGLSDSRLAPYYIQSNTGGKFTAGAMTLAGVEAHVATDTTARLTWGAGVEIWGGATRSNWFYTTTATDHAGTTSLTRQHERPAAAWIQQAYLTGRYRCMTLTLGQREQKSVFTGNNSSGDLTRGNNAHPLPGIELAFDRYRTIPYTAGWVQVFLNLGFFYNTDDSWIKHHTALAGSSITTGYRLAHKSLFLRSNPSRPVMVTLGIQTACQFGGTTTTRDTRGDIISQTKIKSDFSAYLHSIIPSSGGNATGDHYYEGNHVGSIDIAIDWHIKNGHTMRAYHQNPFEDASGMGKLNGWDGLYGLEYIGKSDAIVSNVVVEYLTTVNQSGPVHWAPKDHPDTFITHEATGSDDYYNNYCYNGYHTAGMSIGTPMLVSPIWNTSGVVRFNDNRIRGFHLAVEGHINSEWGYRVLGGYRNSWGTYSVPRGNRAHDTSFLLETTYKPSWLSNITARAQAAMDRGTLIGNRFGALITVSYSGCLDFKRHKR